MHQKKAIDKHYNVHGVMIQTNSNPNKLLFQFIGGTCGTLHPYLDSVVDPLLVSCMERLVKA